MSPFVPLTVLSKEGSWGTTCWQTTGILCQRQGSASAGQLSRSRGAGGSWPPGALRAGDKCRGSVRLPPQSPAAKQHGSLHALRAAGTGLGQGSPREVLAPSRNCPPKPFLQAFFLWEEPWQSLQPALPRGMKLGAQHSQLPWQRPRRLPDMAHWPTHPHRAPRGQRLQRAPPTLRMRGVSPAELSRSPRGPGVSRAPLHYQGLHGPESLRGDPTCWLSRGDAGLAPH